MNLQEFLLNREKRRKRYEEELQEKAQGGRCYSCFRPKKHCLCSVVRSFPTHIRFVLLMHPMEAKKERLGTGRLAHLCLENSEIIVGFDFTHHPRVEEIIRDPANHAMVLYPGKTSLNLSTTPFPKEVLEQQDAPKRPVLFLIDGTWPCAKKIMKLSKNLQGLPRLCFTPEKASQFTIKEQPQKHCLSTIESIFYFLEAWEKQGLQNLEGRHHHLIEIFQNLVQFQIQCALDPNLPSYRKIKKGYKGPEDRSPSLKWQKRRVFFEEENLAVQKNRY